MRDKGCQHRSKPPSSLYFANIGMKVTKMTCGALSCSLAPEVPHFPHLREIQETDTAGGSVFLVPPGTGLHARQQPRLIACSLGSTRFLAKFHCTMAPRSSETGLGSGYSRETHNQRGETRAWALGGGQPGDNTLEEQGLSLIDERFDSNQQRDHLTDVHHSAGFSECPHSTRCHHRSWNSQSPFITRLTGCHGNFAL